jgi:GT2 family glycosyltransferase
MKKIGFVIPVFNRLKYTQECLEILSQQKTTRFFAENEIFIIVSDDGSTDGTKDWIQANHPDVIVLKGTGDLWYSGSMNLGIRYAFEKLNCDFIMVWENDIFPVDDYFNHLQSILEKWDGKSLICSKLYYRDQPNKIFGMGGTFNTRTGVKSLIGQSEIDNPEYEKIMEVDWFLGQGVLIHKDIMAKVGYFDDVNFPQYHADVDYGLRAMKGGYKNLVYPDLKLLNDTEMTGISHIRNKTIRQFLDSLFSIRSNYNIRKDIRFYRIHTTHIGAFGNLFYKYLAYIGGYAKWRILGLFGIKKKE